MDDPMLRAQTEAGYFPLREYVEINSCDVATPAPANEAGLYRKMRDGLIRAHCAAKREHNCCGRITIDRAHITFNCPLCGDARQLI